MTVRERGRASRLARLGSRLRALCALCASRASSTVFVIVCGIATGLVTGLAAGPADAQPDTPAEDLAPLAAAPSVTIQPPDLEMLRAQIERVEADGTIDEAVREALLAELRATRALLERAEAHRSRIASLAREAAERESILAALSAELSAPVTDKRRPDESETIAVLAGDAAEIEDALVTAIATLLAARREQTRLSGRAPRIGEEIAQALQRGENAARAPPPAETGDAALRTLLGESRELMQRLRWRESVATVVALRSELATLPAQRTIAAARASLAADRVTRLTRVLEQHQSALGAARVGATAADLVVATEAATGAATDATAGTDTDTAADTGTAVDPQLTVALAQRRLELAREEWQMARRLVRTRTDLVDLYGLRNLIDGVSDAGLAPDDLAGLLRGLDERLPDTDSLLAEREEASRVRSALQVERFGWDERLERRDTGGTLGVVNSLSGGRDTLLGGPPGSVVGDAETIVGTPGSRADGTRLLIALIEDANRLSDLLTEREIALQESLVRAANIETFLSRSLLGLRTDESAGIAWLARLPEGVARLTDASAWHGVGAALLGSTGRFPLRALVFAAIVAVLLFARPGLRRRLGELASRVGHVGRDGHWVTPTALLLSLPRALPLPLVLWFASLQLGLPGERGELAPALGVALGEIAPVLFVILLVRVFARPDGLLHAHFGWSREAAGKLRRHLLWLGWTVLSAGLLLVLAEDAGQGELRYGIGVPALLAVSIALALFIHACFHASRGVASLIRPDTPTSRVMVALYPLLLLAPLLIGLLPLVGYFDTAIELQLRLVASLSLLVAVVVVHGLARRVYLVAHRRLSLQRVRRLRARRERERVTGTVQPATGQASPSSLSALEENEQVAMDLERVERQTRRILTDVAILLLLLGLWLVWRTLLPAFDTPQASTLGQIASSAGTAGGVNGAAAALAPDGLSLRGVILALFLITVGLIASRNIRGILELAVFERLRLDAGARYAIVAITGYVLVGASLVAGLSQLGVDWSKLQWIVAALGVGLGFGLQEIVANFVSGLIILFERPIRVGDVVTIGNLSGTVSNIRIRATTVTDFDNLEVMLPNKTIITENVTNWTLSDSVTRIILSVSVAYGSDVERVRSLLEGAIIATDDILDDPEWTVFFMRHAENAMVFELRVFVPAPEYRLPVTHALNTRCTAALRAAGIEIPHPQRSVTIRRQGGSGGQGDSNAPIFTDATARS